MTDYCLPPCGMLVPNGNHIKGIITLVLMHNDIVNMYQPLCDAHTVPPSWPVGVVELWHKPLTTLRAT